MGDAIQFQLTTPTTPPPPPPLDYRWLLIPAVAGVATVAYLSTKKK